MHQSGGAGADSSAASAELNPLNNMPALSQARAPSQDVALSRERTTSSIPRAASSAAPGDSPYAGAAACPIAHDAKRPAQTPQGGKETAACPIDHGTGAAGAQGHWEYPSPQQFHNALVRKGMETAEEDVDMMVLIHNFLNERAWQEVVAWEKLAGSDASQLQLARFQGRPGTLSPRARLFGWLGWAMPNSYSSEPPFDRHDWVIRRGPTDAHPNGEEVRYVIDYYSSDDSDDGSDEASFNLDVRPAIDSLDALRVRWQKALDDWRARDADTAARAPVTAAVQ